MRCVTIRITEASHALGASLMLKETLESDVKKAMKAGDAPRVSVLRMMLAAIKNREIAAMKKDTGLAEDEVAAVLKTEVRKRRDSVAEFEKGGRTDLATKERAEIAVIEPYLPAEATDEEIAAAAESAIAETGASAPADFGKAMKTAMALLKGRADGARVSEAVKRALGA